MSRQPLARLSSIRSRLAVLVAVSIVSAALVGTIGADAGVPLWLSLPATIAVALVVTRWLSAGMTTPLREMTTAAQHMARGDYSARITTSGQDEVGALARAFARMARDLDQADEDRRRLVATVAHELRTPLSAQRALLENLVDGVIAPDDAALRNALTQSERLSSLVADLLDLSRPHGSGVRLSTTTISVRALLDAAVDEASLGGRDLALLTEVQPEDLSVSGDPDRLAQVTANLLDNAIRHSPPGGSVRLAARAEADQWTLTVADEGPGLSPEHAERIAHRFGPGGDEGGGTGLGLAISAWVAAMHGGTIRALESSDGARLQLSLPREPQPVSPSSRPLVSAAPSSTPPNQPTGLAKEPDMSVDTAPTPEAPVAVGAKPSATLARWWPERSGEGAPWALTAALIVGALAALLLPEHQIGLGLLIVLASGGAVIWFASPRRSLRWSWLSALLSLPLAASVILRDDAAFSFPAVAVAGVLAATACTGARTLGGVGVAVLGWFAAALRGLPWLDRTVRAVARRGRGWSILRTSVISLALLGVFGGLLSSADAVLGSWMSALVPHISDVLILRIFTAIFFAGVTLAGLYLAINPPPVDELKPTDWTASRIPVREWQIPLGVVIAVFALFIIAQGAALFGGHDYVLRTTGVTYADSARQGFGQLTLATGAVLLLIAGVRAWGRADTARDQHILRVMSAILCLLTLLVVASALRRMALYQQAYGYTTLRVGVDLFEIWLGVVVLAVLISLFVPARRWLGRSVLLAGVAMTMIYSVGNTSAWVAERNIERYQATGKLDTAYLANLPVDAVPAIQDSSLPADLKACLRTDPYQVSDAVESPAGWNFARHRAQEYEVRPAPGANCLPQLMASAWDR